MTVISVEKDAESLTMTIIAQFDAPTTRVWQVWQDPPQLERSWRPPTYPATVVGHDLTPGGIVTYFMTGQRATPATDGGRCRPLKLPATWSSSTASPTRTAIPIRRCPSRTHGSACTRSPAGRGWRSRRSSRPPRP
jgi:Activator of Hsp90 ATPase homolog 1-like protein